MVWTEGVNLALNRYNFYVDSIGGSARYGLGCGDWQDVSGWLSGTGQSLFSFALASTNALGDRVFWTRSVASLTMANSVQGPLWSY